MTRDKVDEFLAWIDQQEERRGWSDYRLAKEANISTSILSRARKEGVLPKWEVCLAIAQALHVSPVTAFRKAGLIPPGPEDQVRLEDWEHLLSRLDDDDREELRQIAEMKITKRRKDQGLKTLEPKKAK